MRTTYFAITDFFRSYRTKENEIENKPSEEIISNIAQLIKFLDEMQENYSNKIVIRTGYKNEDAVNLTKDDKSHASGFTADLSVREDFDSFVEFLSTYMLDKNFDECKIESKEIKVRTRKDDEEPEIRIDKWIHLSLFNEEDIQRNLLNLTNNN